MSFYMEKTVIKIESLAGVEPSSAEFAAAMDRAADAFVKAMDQATVFAFFGEMGAGKTTFISALVRHLGVEEDESTSSPSFAIVNEYRSSTTAELMYHFDLYRLESMEEALDIGIEDYFDSGALCFVEWPDKVVELMPEDAVRVDVKVGDDGSRELTLSQL